MLRTYNVGETDRFCILFSLHAGRIAARANGVRRLLSRRCAGLLPLHRIHVTYELRSSGYVIASASPRVHVPFWKDPCAFSCAQRGVEILLRLTEEGEALPDVYVLVSRFLDACAHKHPAHLSSVFALKLLHLLGLFPSLKHSSLSHLPLPEHALVAYSSIGGVSLQSENPDGIRLSHEGRNFLLTIPSIDLVSLPPCSESLLREIERFLHCLLGSQLGVPLAAPAVSLAMSSGVTPI